MTAAPEREPPAPDPLPGCLAGRRAAVWVAAALLAVPLVGHGCHGADVDHEPLLTPHRSTPEDQ